MSIWIPVHLCSNCLPLNTACGGPCCNPAAVHRTAWTPHCITRRIRMCAVLIMHAMCTEGCHICQTVSPGSSFLAACMCSGSAVANVAERASGLYPYCHIHVASPAAVQRLSPFKPPGRDSCCVSASNTTNIIHFLPCCCRCIHPPSRPPCAAGVLVVRAPRMAPSAPSRQPRCLQSHSKWRLAVTPNDWAC